MRQIPPGTVPRPDSAHMCPLLRGAAEEMGVTSLGAEPAGLCLGASEGLCCILAHVLGRGGLPSDQPEN